MVVLYCKNASLEEVHILHKGYVSWSATPLGAIPVISIIKLIFEGLEYVSVYVLDSTPSGQKISKCSVAIYYI
jgi:hypothetical protein